MNINVGITALLGALALCTIVGIYYIWVRKLGRPGEPSTQSPHGRHPQ